VNRGKKIVFLSHCILNANAKVEGLAAYPGAAGELITYLMDQGVGMLQLPCPEVDVLGVQRWGHVKNQLSHPFFIECCEKMLAPVVRQVEMYRNGGYQLIGVVGIDGSPCCGVKKTCASEKWAGDFLDPELTWKKVADLAWVKKPGIFMETFQKMLAGKHADLDFFSLDESDPTASVPRLIAALSQRIHRP